MKCYLLFIIAVVILAVTFIARGAEMPATQRSDWRQFPNGRDLGGWEMWARWPHASVTGVDVPKDENGAYTDVGNILVRRWLQEIP